MVEILFPAHKIKPGSRIVIWGANTVGMCFYEQIQSLRHGAVITFIDSRVKKTHLKADINTPEWLWKNQTGYDYILIGSARKSVRDEIKQILLEKYHISAAKIVSDGYMPYIKKSGIADMDSADDIADMLNKFGNTDETAQMAIEHIIDRAGQDRILTETLRKLFHDAETIKTRLTCAYILFSIHAGDMVLLKETFTELGKCARDNPMWAHYFMFNTLQSMVMWYPEYKYAEYYMERKKVMQEIAGVLYGKKTKDKPADRRKIAIACSTPLIGGKWHITKMVAYVANGLRKKGYEISVFIESKVYAVNEFFINTRFADRRGLSVFEDSNRTAFDEDIPILYSEGKSMREHTNDYVDKIIEYNPGNIIFFSADSTCAASVLYDLFPITYIPTVNFGLSADFHCALWVEPEQLLEVNREYPWKDKGQCISKLNPIVIPYETKKTYRREDKRWKHNEFIVVTVGNRLEFDLKNKFVDAVCSEIERKQELKWVLIGISAIDYINTNYKDLVESKRIEYINYENDLPALYKIADAYLNPDRSGGGMSIAYAMQAGIPVIALDAVSDAMPWIGRGNGIKGGYGDLMDELRKLIENKEYYAYRSKKMTERSKNWGSEACMNSIISGMEKACGIFEARKCLQN